MAELITILLGPFLKASSREKRNTIISLLILVTGLILVSIL